METRADGLNVGAGDWLLMQMEVTLAENWRALAKAKSAGAKAVLNLAPAMPIDAAVLAQLDMLIVNQPEAQLLGSVLGIGSSEHLAIASEIARRYDLTCIATLGEHGSVAVEASGRGWRVGRIDVDVVDTTGAGDAYVGYLVAALDRGSALPEAMRFASTGASLSCETRGAQSAYLARTAIEKRMTALARATEI